MARRSRDLLRRFRLAGTPGPAAAHGVPPDRVAELGSELGPVLARLDDTEHRTTTIRSAARDRADGVLADAEERAHALLAAARQEAEAERADAAVRAHRRSTDESAVLLAEAEREVERIRRQADLRMATYVDQVVAGVRATVEGLPS